MSETKFTKGPWRIDNAGMLNKIKSCEAAPRTIAVIDYQSPHLMTDAERLANARLIASAPELLEALQQAAKQFDCTVSAMAQGHTVSVSSLQNCAAMAKDAIRKATGKDGR